MLTTRASTRLMDMQTASPWFDPARSSSPHLDSSHNPTVWPSNLPSDYAPDQSLLIHQESNSMRVGYATRASTAQQRASANPEYQVMGVSSMFVGTRTSNGTGIGSSNAGIIRKKRRRYGPKPEPPYQCFCGKIFKRHEHMLRHRATHDDQIKYECHICGKCFRRQDVMHRHTMTHTNRSRLQNKSRNATSTRSPSGMTRHPAANDHSDGSAENKPGANGRFRWEQEHTRLGHAGAKQDDVLEDPLLRVGLAENPAPPTSASHNDDHHIAAAQLYTAFNGARYTYPSPVNVQPSAYWSESGEPIYARASNMSTVEAPYTRVETSMSPPPPLLAHANGLAPPEALEPPPFGIPIGRPCLSMQVLPGLGELDSKIHSHEAGPYGQGWHGSYSFAYGAMHATESDWSEQSPSVPSTHTFTSPAWSHKGELIRRDGASSASNGTPLDMNRQLPADSTARWQQPQQQYHPQLHQQGSLIFNRTSGPSSLFRSPAPELRRRFSTIDPTDAYCNANAESYNMKPEAFREFGEVALGLFDAKQANCGSTPLSSMLPGPTMTNGAIASYGTQTYQPSNNRSSENKAECKEQPEASSEPLDSGSPLTEATGQASPRSQPCSNTSMRYDRGSDSTREAQPVDPYLMHGGQAPNLVAGPAHGHERKRWDHRY